MPFFGSKKKSDEKKVPPPSGAYPTAPPALSGQYSGPDHYSSPPGVAAAAPPPYTPYAGPTPQANANRGMYSGLAETSNRGYAPYPAAVGPDGATIGAAAPPMRPLNAHSQTMAAPYPQYGAGAPGQPVYQQQVPTGPPVAHFDAGARFSTGQVRIPPPPPGCMPNAAQIAAAQGQQVQVNQKKGDVWNGSGGGGYTFGL